MKESVTYQAILEEGEVLGEAKGERNALLRIAAKKLGPPNEQTRQAIDAITDLSVIFRLQERLLDVTTWNDLLAE